MNKTTHREQLITKVPIPNTDDVIEVSSVHYDIGSARLNETCVFFPNGDSEVRGSYDDHQRIVDELMHA
jgi:hypothetical protein